MACWCRVRLKTGHVTHLSKKMLTQVAKELYNAQYRILDHRTFLAGEIESFRCNFETKRNDREVELLFKSIATAGEIKYELSSRCVSLGQTHLKAISGELDKVLKGIEQFQEVAKQEKPVSEKLVQSRVQRAQRKDNFCKDLEHAYQRVENSFEEKEEEIADLYTDLQIKLNIPKY